MQRSCLWFAIIFLAVSTACSTAPRDAGDFKIALTPARRGQYGVFTMNADTTGGKLLTSDPGAQLRLSSWSPNGKTIAFFTTRSKDAAILEQYRMPFHYLLYTIGSSGGSDKLLLDVKQFFLPFAVAILQKIPLQAQSDRIKGMKFRGNHVVPGPPVSSLSVCVKPRQIAGTDQLPAGIKPSRAAPPMILSMQEHSHPDAWVRRGDGYRTGLSPQVPQHAARLQHHPLHGLDEVKRRGNRSPCHLGPTGNTVSQVGHEA